DNGLRSLLVGPQRLSKIQSCERGACFVNFWRQHSALVFEAASDNELVIGCAVRSVLRVPRSSSQTDCRQRCILVASRVYDSLDDCSTVSPRRSAAMTTLESRISPMRADSAVHGGC